MRSIIAPRRRSPRRGSLSRRVALVLSLLFLLASQLIVAPSGPAAAEPPVLEYDVSQVHVGRLSGAVDLGMARYLTRAVRGAEGAGAALLIVIDSTGGRVDAALTMRDAVLRSQVPTIALVENRAWSAAALVAMAADTLIMTPGSSIGAAEPAPLTTKTLSALRAEFESTAEARGRDPALAGAMVDANLAVEGLVGPGQLLSLTAGVAIDLAFADAGADSVEDALALTVPAGATTREVGISAAERAARVITHPAVAPVLLTIALVALLIEVFVVGFGAAGIVGLVSLGLFFGGHLVAGFGGWEVAALFILGLILLLVEAVVPGFGVFGVGGIGSIVASIFLVSREGGDTVRSLAIALIASVLLSVLLLRLGVRRGWFRRLALYQTMVGEKGYLARRPPQELVGQEGQSTTVLRPAGTARFGDQVVDVVTEGTFVPSGTTVAVIKVEGPRVVVRPTASPNNNQRDEEE